MRSLRLRGNHVAVALFLLICLGWLPGGVVQPRRAQAASLKYRPDQIIVEINPAAGITDDNLNAELGTTTLQQLRPGAPIFLLQTPPAVDPAVLSEQLDLDRRIAFAEPNYIGHAPEANPRGIGAWGGTDPAPLAVQYALSEIGLADALQLSSGAGTTVAVIDTGVQLDHPAIASSLRKDGYDFVDGDGVPADVQDGLDQDGDGLPDDAFGHGTHIAGIVHLVAPQAKILPLRALTAEGDGDVFHVVQAIDYAVSHRAAVINLSLGTDLRSSLLRDAVRDATRGGVVVVAAAGNDSTDIEQYPAANSCVIAVSAVGAANQRSAFANYGSWVTVSAPGESIFSAFPPSGYAWWSGTSMATPFVAGQAALIRSLRPDLDARDVASLIGGTAREIDTLNPSFANLLGDGRIDLAASLRAAAAGTIPPSRHSRVVGSCLTIGE
jgi:subtilisin family serine protease